MVVPEEITNNVPYEACEVDKKLDERGLTIQEINDRLEAISLVQGEISQHQDEIQKLQNSISTNEQYVNKIQKQIDELQQQEHTEDDKDKLEKYRKAYSKLQDIDSELTNKKHYHELAELLLRDSGIKTKIIRQYLPIMNKLINKYLASMEFFVQFELDEKFCEH